MWNTWKQSNHPTKIQIAVHIQRGIAHYHMILFLFLSSFVATMWNQNKFSSPRFVVFSHFTYQIHFLKHRILWKYNAGTTWYVTCVCIYWFLIYKTRIIISSCQTLSRIMCNHVCKNSKAVGKCKVSLVIIITIIPYHYQTKLLKNKTSFL